MTEGKDWDRVVPLQLATGIKQVALKVPKAVNKGLVLHGAVLSKDHIYRVAKYRTGRGRHSYRCACDYNILTRGICKHIAAFIVAERETI